MSDLVFHLRWEDSVSDLVLGDAMEEGGSLSPENLGDLDDLTLFSLVSSRRAMGRLDEGCARQVLDTLLARADERGVYWTTALDVAFEMPGRGMSEELADQMRGRMERLAEWLFRDGDRGDFDAMLKHYRSGELRGTLLTKATFLPSDLELFNNARTFVRDWGDRPSSLEAIESGDLLRLLDDTVDQELARAESAGGRSPRTYRQSRGSSELLVMNLVRELDGRGVEWPPELVSKLASSRRFLDTVIRAQDLPFSREDLEALLSHPSFKYSGDSARLLLRMPGVSPDMLAHLLGNKEFLERALVQDWGVSELEPERQVSTDMWDAVVQRVIEGNDQDLVVRALEREDLPASHARELLRARQWGSRPTVRHAVAKNKVLRRLPDLRLMLEGSAVVDVHLELVKDAGAFDVSDSLALIMEKGTTEQILDTLSALPALDEPAFPPEQLGELMSSDDEGVRQAAFEKAALFGVVRREARGPGSPEALPLR